MPGLYRLDSLPHGLAGELAEFLADRLRRLLPGFLFAAGNPDCQRVTHALCVTHAPSSLKPRNNPANGLQSTVPAAPEPAKRPGLRQSFAALLSRLACGVVAGGDFAA